MYTSDIDVLIDGVRFLVRACGVAIIDGRVLLSRGRDDPFWCLPGGRCRIEEATALALQREMEEEIGVRVEAGRLLWVLENFFVHGEDSFHEIGFCYLLDSPEELAGDHLPLEESIEYEWFPLESLPPIVPPFLGDALGTELPGSPRYILECDRPAGFRA